MTNTFTQTQADQVSQLLNYLWTECQEYKGITNEYDTCDEALSAYQDGELGGLIENILSLNEHLYGVSATDLIKELY